MLLGDGVAKYAATDWRVGLLAQMAEAARRLEREQELTSKLRKAREGQQDFTTVTTPHRTQPHLHPSPLRRRLSLWA